MQPQRLVGDIYIGTSGWNYKHWWNEVFYPRSLKPAHWLDFYSRRFQTVELNSSFYRLPTAKAFETWRSQVPDGFVFSVKASRFITHIRRLRDPEEPLELLFSRALLLEDRLGPVLFQLPPQFKLDLDRLNRFLDALEKYLALGVRCVVEVRDRSWLTDAVFDALRLRTVALCLADWRDMPVDAPLTAPFVYARRHYGKAEGGNYGHDELDADVKRIEAWGSEGRDVYMYFNNDWQGFALENAAYVLARLQDRRAGLKARTASPARGKRRRIPGASSSRDR